MVKSDDGANMKKGLAGFEEVGAIRSVVVEGLSQANTTGLVGFTLVATR
jgi:hypothetical protein